MTRVLHLPTPVGGMPYALAQAERALGLESEVLYTGINALEYPGDVNLHLEQAGSGIARYFKLLRTFISVRKRYDVFHFNSGSSLFQLLRFPGLTYADLAFYPKGRKLFVTYNGCDARQKYPTMKKRSLSACHGAECYGGICNSGERDVEKRRGIKTMAKYVQHMWAVNPDLLYFLPKEKSSFLPYAVTIDENRMNKPRFDGKRVRIIHAPTDRKAKGSDIIIAAIKELERTHRNLFEFRLIENIPHGKVIEVFRESDLLIDQMLVGWYGGVAAELMHMGRPVVCRIAEEDLQFIPSQMHLDLIEAFIQAEPETLKATILRCIEDRTLLKRKAEAALHYARTWHDPRYVASVTKQAYETP